MHDINNSGALLNLLKIFIPLRNAEKSGGDLAKALQKLGPTFIKLGQALSVRADIVGDDIALSLAHLQDELPPFSSKDAKQILEEEFQTPLDSVFKKFDEKPVAAASIAQVHFAEDFEGNKLAVKILRPDVEEAFTKDIALLKWLAKKLNKNLELKRLHLPEIVEEFEKSCLTELDLRMEAAAASELAENMADDADIQVPKVYWNLTSRRNLTIERVYGLNIKDIKTLKKAGYKPEEILQSSANIFFQQVFRDGFFHADMHPGNIFIGQDGQLIVVDFGIMGRLDIKTRMYLAEMLIGFLNRDYQLVSDVHFKAGYIPKDQDRFKFAQACRSIGEPLFGLSQNEISIAKLLEQLFKITKDFKMETQPQLLLLQKTMVQAEGLGRILNPSVNFWELCRPLMEQWAKENFGPKGKAKFVNEYAKDAIEKVNMVGEVIDYLPSLITKDGIKIHPETLKSMRKEKQISYWKIGISMGIYTGLMIWFLN